MKNSISVQVVILNDQGQVLGVSRKTNHNDFGLPGGKVEPYDKSLKMAAVREVKEETGLDIFNIDLIFAMHRNGHMGYTYLAEFSGEINYDEPHVVKWVNYSEVIKGSFGTWNTYVLESLISKGIKITL